MKPKLSPPPPASGRMWVPLAIISLGLALVGIITPKIASYELRSRQIPWRFQVAVKWPIVGDIYDIRSVRSAFEYYPLPKDSMWCLILPSHSLEKTFTARVIPAFSHLLRNSDIGISLVLISAVIVPLTLPKRRPSQLYGGARWNGFPTWISSSLRRSRRGIVVGQHHGQLLVHNGVENVLVLGPPGEGKTYGCGVPTLRATWHESLIAYDPTRELSEETAEDRKAFGRVFVFDPTSKKTHRFNPLAGIQVGDTDRLKRVLTPLFDSAKAKGGDDAYFVNRASAIATATCAFMIENGQPELSSVLSFIRSPQWKSPNEPFEVMKTSAIKYVRETGAEFAAMPDKTRAPLVSTFTDIFEVFATDNVENATSGSDFSAEDFANSVTSLYLVVREADAPRFSPLIRLVLARLLDDLMLEKPGSERPRILLFIDEFPLLEAPFIQTKLGTMRKYRITTVLLAQTLSQLTRIYGANQSVDGTCGVKVFYATEDRETQQLANDLLGTTTQFDRAYDSEGLPAGTREQPRPLLLQQDFSMLGDRIVITKIKERPILAGKVKAYKDRRFRRIRPGRGLKYQHDTP